jgi:hypothetical protein
LRFNACRLLEPLGYLAPAVYETQFAELQIAPGIAAEHDVVPIEAGKAAKKRRVARNRKSANG